MIIKERRQPSLRCDAMWHPWRALGGMPHVTLQLRRDMPLGLRAATDGSHIVISARLLQRERRAALTHELEHIRLGRTDHCTARDESLVRQAAARRLISVEELVQALLWTRDIEELAEELWVDAETVKTRLEHLHPSERHYLRRRLASHEEIA
jgi:hypothetical protein